MAIGYRVAVKQYNRFSMPAIDLDLADEINRQHLKEMLVTPFSMKEHRYNAFKGYLDLILGHLGDYLTSLQCTIALPEGTTTLWVDVGTQTHVKLFNFSNRLDFDQC